MKDELYQIFEKYKSPVFFETGSHLGYSIQRAVDIGYENIHSIDINLSHYNHCVSKFRTYDNVSIWHGDSLEWIPVLLNDIDEKCTFWLDAHMSGISRNCPTLEELKLIGKHHIKNHTILIDDMVDFGTQAHENITIADLQWEILKINPDYKFSFESTSKPNNVMVCLII